MDDRSQRRQVLPDVDEGAEIGGYSIMSLLRLFTPTFALLFYGINLAPPGFIGPLAVGLGLLAGLVTVVIIGAAPSGEPPVEYAYQLWRSRNQEVKRHE